MNRILISTLVLFLFLSSCQKEVSQEIGTPSSGSLQNAAGECMPKNVGGNFMVNKVLTDSNFIDVSVDVLLPGSYTIFTDTVNGYSFKGQGSFASAGPATVKLQGTGNPLVAGTDDFTVVYDSTFCSISVTVLPEGTPPPSGSGLYFPTTNNSWWSYDEGGTDTIKYTVSGTTTISGKTYSRFIGTDDFGALDTLFYRMDAATNSYYQSIEAADLEAAFGIDLNDTNLDILFLKESLTTNATWNSDHAGNAGGLPITWRFKFTCVNNNATLSINGKNFTNVYHVRLNHLLGTLGTFTDMGIVQDFYYAKGVGWIMYDDSMDELNIRNWVVN